MRKEDFQFMVEGMVSDLIQLLIERRGLTMTEAFDIVYKSKTYGNNAIFPKSWLCLLVFRG